MITTLWKPKYLTAALLSIAGLLVGYLCYRVFRPFLAPAVWATVLALLLYPVYGRAARLLRSRSLAALVLCILATAILALPCVLLLAELRSQIWDVYDEVEAALADPGGRTADATLLRAWRWAVETAARTGYQLPAALSEVLQRGASRLIAVTPQLIGGVRSEERRVGKECRL